MQKYSKSFTIKVTSLTTGNVYTCDSIQVCSSKTGISRQILTNIKRGKRSSFAIGSNGKPWQIQFIADKACTLYPAWDTMLDAVQLGEQTFSSHIEAIKFLSQSGPSKLNTYYRRMAMQPLGVPCSKTIKDVYDREWIITFFKEKEQFIPNKKVTSSCD